MIRQLSISIKIVSFLQVNSGRGFTSFKNEGKMPEFRREFYTN